MSELFIVWISTSGVFGFTAKPDIGSACEIAEKNHGHVFVLKDPGSRYAVNCFTPGCDFPGWITVPLTCFKEPETKQTVPSHWEAR